MAESKSKTKTSTETTTTEITPKRGRGHPKGAGGYKRPDSTVQAEPGDNRKYLEHNLKMRNWPSVDMKKLKTSSNVLLSTSKPALMTI